MADAQTRSPEPDRPPRRALRWWLAAATFVLGLLVGAVAVGLASDGSVELPAGGSAAASADGSGPTRSSSAPAGATAQVVVDEACLRALNAAQDMYGAIDDLGRAIANFNAARLDEVVRRLQPLQARLRENIGNCHVLTRLPDGTTVSGTPSPTSASPTA